MRLQAVHCGVINPQALPGAFLDTVGGVLSPGLLAHGQWSEAIQRDLATHLHRCDGLA